MAIFKCDECGYEINGDLNSFYGEICLSCKMGYFNEIKQEYYEEHQKKQSEMYKIMLNQFCAMMKSKGELEKRNFIDLFMSMHRTYGDRGLFDLAMMIATTMEKSCYTCAQSDILFANNDPDEICQKRILCKHHAPINQIPE